MKTYKLKSWPDLPPVFRRTGYTRALSALSHQFITEDELQQCGSLPASEVRHLLRHLDDSGALETCDMPELSPSTSGNARRRWPLSALRRRAA